MEANAVARARFPHSADTSNMTEGDVTAGDNTHRNQACQSLESLLQDAV